MALYRSGGFEALYPKARVDRGRPRRLPPDIAELLVGLKTEQPSLSVNALIGAARERGVERPLAPSTVHRLLSREGLLDKRPGEPVAIDRRRFAFRYAGELWMSDVMHGPKVSDGRRRRKTFLMAFIDDATRVLPFAAFDFSESTTAFLPVLKSALTRRGLPLRLYVDNGANYRSHQLALVCAKLGIALIHARPWQPAGKGKIERFFRTLRAAWLERLDADATLSLEALNRSLWAWVEGEYHQSPHRGIDGRTPLEQWALAGENVRYPGPDLDLDDLFLFEAKRRVMKDRTVSLHGRLYEVDAILVGQSITLRYDPQAPASRPLQVRHDGRPAGEATRLDAYANTKRACEASGTSPSSATAPPGTPSPTTPRPSRDRTVSLHGRLYEVDAILVGQSITLRYDPQTSITAGRRRAPSAGPPRRAPRGRSHTPRRLRQYQAELAKQAELPRQARPLLLARPARRPRARAATVTARDAKAQGEELMYLRHFALTRLPFETPAHTDELFDSNSRREAETRLNHLIELRGIGLLTERAHEVSGTSK